jgi:catechol 2,3-dioxygenase-like lactoylglutathione lyase family enzyme
MDSWPSGISAITLFVENLEDAKVFYREVFGLPVMFEDEASTVFDFGNTIINLLLVDAAMELIEPAAVAKRDVGSRVQFTIEVDDVDQVCAELANRGVELLNGPIDRPWGIRPPASPIPGVTSGRSPRNSESRTSGQPPEPGSAGRRRSFGGPTLGRRGSGWIRCRVSHRTDIARGIAFHYGRGSSRCRRGDAAGHYVSFS